MSTRIPPPNWLRTFEAAARHLSFTSAAQELHVTQSAVSQHVRLLEHYLQETLFVRHKRRLELTQAGKAYLEILSKSFGEIRRGTEELFGPKNPGRINLKTNVSFSTLWLAPRFQRFSSRHPDCELRISNAVWWDFSDNSEAELEIRFGDGNWPGLRSYKLVDETLTPVAHPDFAAKHNLISPGHLLSVQLFHTMGHLDGWSDWLTLAGVDPGNIQPSLQFDTATLSLAMAQHGHGVALGLRSLRQNLVESGHLALPFPQELPVDEGFYLVIPENHTKKSYTDSFIDWLLSEAEAANRD